MKHLIDIMQLTTEEIDEMIDTANDIIANPDKYAEKCKRKKLATLFFRAIHQDSSQLRGGYVRTGWKRAGVL